MPSVWSGPLWSNLDLNSYFFTYMEFRHAHLPVNESPWKVKILLSESTLHPQPLSCPWHTTGTREKNHTRLSVSWHYLRRHPWYSHCHCRCERRNSPQVETQWTSHPLEWSESTCLGSGQRQVQRKRSQGWILDVSSLLLPSHRFP